MNERFARERLMPTSAWHAAAIWLIVRAAWLCVALVFAQSQSPAAERFLHRDALGRAYVHTPVQLFDMWTRQDAALYAEIAAEGYSTSPPYTLCAFFPLFPLLIRFVSALSSLPYWASGLLIGNLCDLGGWVVVWRYLCVTLGRGRAGAAFWAFALFPSRNFGFSGYTEGPYLLAIAGGLWAMHNLSDAGAAKLLHPERRASQRQWGIASLAALCCLLAGGLRPPGALLGLSFALEALGDRRFLRASVFVGSALFVPVCFMVFLQRITGDALAFAHVQSQWHRKFSYFGEVFLSDGKGPDHLGMWLALLTTILLWRQRAALFERLFVSGSLLLPMLTGNVMSMLRFVGVLVPLFGVAFRRQTARIWLVIYFLAAGALSIGFAASVGMGRRVM